MQRSARRSPEQWQSIVNDHQASGLPGSQFCKDHQINYVSFSKWRKRLTESEPTSSAVTTPAFVELTTPELPPLQQWAAELNLGTGIVLRIAKA